MLFADIAGFTELAAARPPKRTVALLNTVFSAFDALAEAHGLEKIKTIGDAYMVVGGLPVPHPDHAAAVAAMALDMQAALVRTNAEQGEQLAITIGVHTGPAVAGVIGTHKFSYDLWGDTVNTASRMQSHGVPGRIQLTGRLNPWAPRTEVWSRRLQICAKNSKVGHRGVLQAGFAEGLHFCAKGSKVGRRGVLQAGSQRVCKIRAAGAPAASRRRSPRGSWRRAERYCRCGLKGAR